MTKFKILMNNVRGYKTKENMIKKIIEEEEPVIMGIVETKLKKGENIDIPGYIPARVDRVEDGGGVMMLYKENLKGKLVSTAEYRINQSEMLWQKLDIGSIKMKMGLIYMPQESRTKVDKLREIYKIRSNRDQRKRRKYIDHGRPEL